jgi:hypothetical protein
MTEQAWAWIGAVRRTFEGLNLKTIGLIVNGGLDHCGNPFIFQARTRIVAELSHRALNINPATE